MADKTPVIIVTGGSGAVGSAVVKGFADFYKNNCHIIIQDIPQVAANCTTLANTLNTNNDKKVAVVSHIDIRKEPEKLVDFAIQEFGYVTTLINCGGFLRDKRFINITEQDYNDIIDIHLNVTFRLTQACWKKCFVAQNFGRVVNISSHASLGNFGQANYSAAKAGVLGLTRTLAIEGKKNNIIVNAIIPFAASAMTKSAFPPEMLEKFDSSYIAPSVVYLASHQNTTNTGEVIQCAGPWISKLVEYTPYGQAYDTSSNIQTRVAQVGEILGNVEQQIQAFKTDDKTQGIYTQTGMGDIFTHMMSVAANPEQWAVYKKQQGNTNKDNKQTTTTTTTTTTQTNNTGKKQLSTPLVADTILETLLPHLSSEIVNKAKVCIGFEIAPGDTPVTGKAANANTAEKRLVVVDLKNGQGGVFWDTATTPLNTTKNKPDATLVINDELFTKLFLQEVEGQTLYLQQKIKVKGNLALVMKFEQVLKAFQDRVDLKAVLKPAAKL
eukprot:UN03015